MLHVIAGPDGSGKSTFARAVLAPATQLPFINANAPAQQPGGEGTHAYDVDRATANDRDKALAARESFIAETVFSDASTLHLVAHAGAAGYLVELHVMLLPVDVAVERVRYHARQGAHGAPENTIRERLARLWPRVVDAARLADIATFYDNTGAVAPFRRVAHLARGRLIGTASWPAWLPFDAATIESAARA